MKSIRLCILFIVLANTSALWSQPLLSPSFSLLSVVPCTSLRVTPSVIPQWESLHGGRGGWTNRAPLHWGETERRRGGEEVEWRRRWRAFQQRQHPPGRSNETERKKNRRRNAVSLTAQRKQNSPRPLLGPKPEAAGSEEEMLSVPEFTPLRRCLGTGGDTAKSHFPALSGLWRKQEEPIHPLHRQYDQVGPILWCSGCSYRWTRREWGEGRRLAN